MSSRHHRYIFEQKESKSKEGSSSSGQQPAVIARMQELGPRFTLKLLSLQKGTFDSKYGEFEWVHKKDMDTSRRRFHL
jgi:ribosome production factor 1